MIFFCFCKLRKAFTLFASDDGKMSLDFLLKFLQFDPSIDYDNNLIPFFFETPLNWENFLSGMYRFGDHVAVDYQNFTGEQYVSELIDRIDEIVYQMQINSKEKVN